jgi:hypothetical protein
MTIATKSVKAYTSKLWRKVQGTMVDAIGYEVEEFGWTGDIKKAKLDASLREVSRPLNINRAGGIASIEEGAYEAEPSSPEAEEITASLVHFNGRVAISKLIKFIDQYGGDTQLKKDIKFRAMHKMTAMKERLAMAYYAPSSAIIATTDTNITAAASDALTLTNGFNQSWITDAAYIARWFVAAASVQKGADKVALLDPSDQSVEGVGFVSAKNAATPSITVTYDATPAGFTTNGIQVVFANSMDNTKNDYNKGFNGWIDALTATSLNGFSSSTNGDWSVAAADTSGGRDSGARIRVQQDAIEDEGGKADRILLDKAVYRDLILQYQSPLRVSDPYALPIDGDVKARGIQWQKSKRVPPGLRVVYDSSVVEKFFWKPDMGDFEDMGWGDLKEMEDVSGFLGTIDFIGNLIWNKRKGLAYARGLTRAT